MSVAETSRHTSSQHAPSMPSASAHLSATANNTRSKSIHTPKRESRACVFHICGGITMLAVGIALLVIT